MNCLDFKNIQRRISVRCKATCISLSPLPNSLQILDGEKYYKCYVILVVLYLGIKILRMKTLFFFFPVIINNNKPMTGSIKILLISSDFLITVNKEDNRTSYQKQQKHYCSNLAL